MYLNVLDKCPDSVQLHATANDDYAFMMGHACYEIVPTEVTWYQAESQCRSRGGHLTDILSSSTLSILKRRLQFFYWDRVWIGLTDHARENHFVWSSGNDNDYGDSDNDDTYNNTML